MIGSELKWHVVNLKECLSKMDDIDYLELTNKT